MLTPEILLQKMEDLVMTDQDNRLDGQTRYYDPPLLAFAAANDPLFTEMKKEEIIGDIYRLPHQWLPEAVTVIVYFLPFSKEIRSSNYSSGLASPQWIHSRFKGEAFNNNMRSLVVSETEKAGGRSLAPLLDKNFITDMVNFTSNWSERHAAYIAGLGTFSLNRGLITAKGMAGRFGSVITSLPFPATPRPYNNNPFQYCPFLQDDSCGICIDRCPSIAISEKGKDKYTCHQYLFIQNPMKDFNENYNYPYSSCGKCQTKVPCEDRIP
ncbi:MAG: epoxyqueuosine reductase [Dethiobacter sp.]|jgi:epoxyqueuosine reductase QueG|nr:epoxyqueuosine reductase [Dethiobacter sp.]